MRQKLLKDEPPPTQVRAPGTEKHDRVFWQERAFHPHATHYVTDLKLQVLQIGIHHGLIRVSRLLVGRLLPSAP